MKADERLYIADVDGERLDRFLTRQVEDLSRSHLQKWIESGKVAVNGKTRKANYKLRAQDVVAVAIVPARPVEIAPESIGLDVLYEDAQMIVLNKPRGMVVHPAAGHCSGTLVNALLAHCADLSGINGELRPGIVHRLDKDTSGVMLAAKTDLAHVSLARQIKDKAAQRSYLAIVHGNLKEENGVITGNIGRHAADRKKMAVVATGGKEATTLFRVLERFGAYTLVACTLRTGRTHQIRVHMTHIGHPLVGDPKYGAYRSPFAIAGQALHSASLRFTHPVSGEVMAFEAPLPDDMQKILTHLRVRGKK